MKTKLFVLSIALTATLSQATFGRDIVSDVLNQREASLTGVKWMGTLRCEGDETDVAHKQEHDCGLTFVNDATGETWDVKNNPALAKIHQKGNREVKAHVEAMKSPRYLLGGSYVEITKIETLPPMIAESESRQTHICSFGNN